ncbi:hypothetical protein B0T09DRAFT_330576 [Sordaria sp. MPI-SDFR-AT-0083]|nr:hypothetical protein B0T09DRAFT_330576 [Sordaria sp. MPI-SDFR-AT-0083]
MRDQSKYRIFGWEFLPREKLDAAANVAVSMKDFIEQAVRASPEASIIWAGVCIVLPLLTSPMLADETNRDGFAYVTSRIKLLVSLAASDLTAWHWIDSFIGCRTRGRKSFRFSVSTLPRVPSSNSPPVQPTRF